MFCPYCGVQRDSDGSFCAHCGKLLSSNHAVQSKISSEEADGGDRMPYSSKPVDEQFSAAANMQQENLDPELSFPCPTCSKSGPVGSKICECGFVPLAPDGAEKFIEQTRPRPWLRYWARMFDLFSTAFIFGILGEIVGLDIAHMNDYLLQWVAVFVWIPFEAILLYSWGTTPGKWVFNIQLTDMRCARLSLGASLRRAFTVVLKGLGLGIPIVSFFTLTSAYSNLMKSGMTTWDQEFGVLVRHRTIGLGRIIVIISTTMIIGALIVFGTLVK